MGELTARAEALDKGLQEASKAREQRLRKAPLPARARMAAELRDMDTEILILTRTLAVCARPLLPHPHTPSVLLSRSKQETALPVTIACGSTPQHQKLILLVLSPPVSCRLDIETGMLVPVTAGGKGGGGSLILPASVSQKAAAPDAVLERTKSVEPAYIPVVLRCRSIGPVLLGRPAAKAATERPPRPPPGTHLAVGSGPSAVGSGAVTCLPIMHVIFSACCEQRERRRLFGS